MYEKTPIKEFFGKYIAVFEKDGYSPKTIRDKQDHCNQILEFAKGKDKKVYSVALGNAFLKRFFELQDEDYSTKAYPLEIRVVVRSVNTLNDFFLGFPFKRQYCRTKHTILNDDENKMLDDFVRYLRAKGYKEGSVLRKRHDALRFLEYFALNKISLEHLVLYDIERLISSFFEYSSKTTKSYVTTLKQLMNSLHMQGVVSEDFSSKLDSVRVYQKSDIPSVWDRKELQLILNAVNRNNPIGKRDYLVLLLASQLGIRGCDIRSLNISDFDWDRDEIRFIQQKTETELVLPLLPEVGEAVIEYLRYGRPASKRNELIVSHNAPFMTFADNSALNAIIVRHARKAGVTLSKSRHHGIHSLRHTFASELLENNIPPVTIAGLLGHNNSATVSEYLKVQTEMLRECALNLGEEIANDA